MWWLSDIAVISLVEKFRDNPSTGHVLKEMYFS